MQILKLPENFRDIQTKEEMKIVVDMESIRLK